MLENHHNIVIEMVPKMVPKQPPRQGDINKPVCFIQSAERDLVLTTKQSQFMTMKELQDYLVAKLNAGYSNNAGSATKIFEVRKGFKYVKLVCTVCKKFEFWFKQDENGGAINYDRLIN